MALPYADTEELLDKLLPEFRDAFKKRIENYGYQLQGYTDLSPEDRNGLIHEFAKKTLDDLKNMILTKEGSEKKLGGSKMFKLSYHGGSTLSASYFIGQEGDDVRVIKAEVVIPMEVQKQITESELKGEESKAVISPEEAIEQIKTACGNTFDGFKKWADALKANIKADAAPVEAAPVAAVTEPVAVPAPVEAAPAVTEPVAEVNAGLKKEAAAGAEAGSWSMDKSEAKPEKLPKAGEVIKSVDEKEAKSEEESLPKDRSSKVKSYYGRLPNKAVGEPEAVSINKESSINEKYQFALKALDEAKAKNVELEKTVTNLSEDKKKVEEGKQNVEKEFGKLKDETDVEKKKGEVDKIVAVLKKELGMAGEDEKVAVDILVKLDPKALKLVSDLFKALFKGEAKAPAMPPFKAASAEAIVSGENLPQVGSVVGSDSTLIETVSKFFDHN